MIIYTYSYTHTETFRNLQRGNETLNPKYQVILLWFREVGVGPFWAGLAMFFGAVVSRLGFRGLGF